MQLAGNIDFCPECRKVLDRFINEAPKESKLYIMINDEAAAPPGHIIIKICDTCKDMIRTEAIDTDGFIVMGR
jgi:hypothetical protein